MLSFSKRTDQPELLDHPDLPFEDIRKNMQELEFINRHLGGHAITLKGLKQVLNGTRDSKKELHVVEVGSGGGDNLRAIANWCKKKNIQLHLTGIDINPECIAFAKTNTKDKNIEFIHSDYKLVDFELLPDVIFSSLFMHHLKDEEVVCMIEWMHRNSRSGFFINDLHRHPLAYYSIKILTKIFSKSYLVKNDAPLSVRKGFKKTEWQKYFSQTGIDPFKCRWQWAFRWLVTYSHAN